MGYVARFLKEYIFIIAFFILLTSFIFRSLLFNISTNLPDWNDYPFIIWTIFQNVAHFQNGSLNGFFDTNAFYPFKGSLLFCELFLPQSLIAYIIHLFINNPVRVFNIIFFLTIFLNIFASFFFWRKFNLSKNIKVFAVLITVYSPFIIINLVHFQLLSMWPMLFALSYLFSKEKHLFSKRDAIMLGIWTSILFVSSAYLAIFTFFVIALWFIFRIWEAYKVQKLKIFVKHFIIFCLIFVVLAGPFVYKYLKIQKSYDIKRQYWEYIIYSAQFTDYFFSEGYDSIIYNLPIFQKWNNFENKQSKGMFPGIALTILSIFGFFSIRRNSKEYNLFFTINSQRLFFALILITGFIFSLGPRLSANGVYLGIPLPYSIFLKINPLLAQVRVTDRWSILFYLGIIFFAILGLQKLAKATKKEKLIVTVFSILFILEIIPINKVTKVKEYYPPAYKVIQAGCESYPKVLLEYPMTQDKKGANVVTNLSYRTQMMLASINHKCNIVNGYSTYIPQDYERFERELNDSVYENDKKKFFSLMKQRQVDIFKLNKNQIFEAKSKVVETWLKNQNKTITLFENKDTLIVKFISRKQKTTDESVDEGFYSARKADQLNSFLL